MCFYHLLSRDFCLLLISLWCEFFTSVLSFSFHTYIKKKNCCIARYIFIYIYEFYLVVLTIDAMLLICMQTGEICLDILKNAWSPAWTLQSVCRAIIALMAHPEPDSPLNCDSGIVVCGSFLNFITWYSVLVVQLYGLLVV